MKSLLQKTLGVKGATATGLRVEGERVVIEVRPHRGEGLRCPACARRRPAYDRGRGEPRLWRALDLAFAPCYLEYAPRRVECPEHGVVTEAVPWARRGSRFTRDFEDWVAWLAAHCDMSTVSVLARVEWHTVGSVCRRVRDDLEASRGGSRFDGLRRIGIDETSYKKGHKYITVVVDHDRGCLVWAHEGTGREVLSVFLDELTREQRRAIEVVTADGAKWIRRLVKKRCPRARWVMDPFHVVQWANDALDEVRREEWRDAKAAYDAARRRAAAAAAERAAAAEEEKKKAEEEKAGEAGGKRKRGRPRKEGKEGKAGKKGPKRGRLRKSDLTPGEAAELESLKEDAYRVKGSRYSLVKNPEDLTDRQRERLGEIKDRAGSRLFRAWELKEDLRAVFRAGTAEEAAALLDDWMRRAGRCRIKPIVEVEKKVRRRRRDVLAAVELGIGNGRVEAINNKVKVTVRMGYGFRNVDNLLALVMLRCGDLKPSLPGRPAREKKGQEKGKKGGENAGLAA